jgi:hypothetical protein
MIWWSTSSLRKQAYMHEHTKPLSPRGTMLVLFFQPWGPNNAEVAVFISSLTTRTYHVVARGRPPSWRCRALHWARPTTTTRVLVRRLIQVFSLGFACFVSHLIKSVLRGCFEAFSAWSSHVVYVSVISTRSTQAIITVLVGLQMDPMLVKPTKLRNHPPLNDLAMATILMMDKHRGIQSHGFLRYGSIKSWRAGAILIDLLVSWAQDLNMQNRLPCPLTCFVSVVPVEPCVFFLIYQ